MSRLILTYKPQMIHVSYSLERRDDEINEEPIRWTEIKRGENQKVMVMWRMFLWKRQMVR